MSQFLDWFKEKTKAINPFSAHNRAYRRFDHIYFFGPSQYEDLHPILANSLKGLLHYLIENIDKNGNWEKLYRVMKVCSSRPEHYEHVLDENLPEILQKLLKGRPDLYLHLLNVNSFNIPDKYFEDINESALILTKPVGETREHDPVVVFQRQSDMGTPSVTYYVEGQTFHSPTDMLKAWDGKKAPAKRLPFNDSSYPVKLGVLTNMLNQAAGNPIFAESASAALQQLDAA